MTIYTIYTVCNSKYLFIFRHSRKSVVLDHLKAATDGHFGVFISNCRFKLNATIRLHTLSSVFCVSVSST